MLCLDGGVIIWSYDSLQYGGLVYHFHLALYQVAYIDHRRRFISSICLSASEPDFTDSSTTNWVDVAERFLVTRF